jgi:hypothetical protein
MHSRQLGALYHANGAGMKPSDVADTNNSETNWLHSISYFIPWSLADSRQEARSLTLGVRLSAIRNPKSAPHP